MNSFLIALINEFLRKVSHALRDAWHRRKLRDRVDALAKGVLTAETKEDKDEAANRLIDYVNRD